MFLFSPLEGSKYEHAVRDNPIHVPEPLTTAIILAKDRVMKAIERFSLAVVAAVVVTTIALTAPAADASTGACTSYLEKKGVDTSLRVQACADAEIIGDTVSQDVSLPLCKLVMAVTLLPDSNAEEACRLSLAP